MTNEFAGPDRSDVQISQVAKSPTGITGLDEILFGGLPKGRATLVCGGPGCGKTLIAASFLLKGATLYDEPGVFFGFEEGTEAIAVNLASIGYDLPALVAAKKVVVDHIRVEHTDGDETGGYDLDGLFIRLGNAIRAVGAKRVVLDTLEALFVGFTDAKLVRAELQRLFRWLGKQGVTVVFTGEAIESRLTWDVEQFVSDCVIMLDHRADSQIATRRLRVLKYRGSAHGTNEYPFLIDERGITVMPITSADLSYAVSEQTISTGVAGLDALLGAGGYYRGSSVCISGVAGSGKSILAGAFAHANCANGERGLYVLFEEPTQQVVRNMRKVGIDLLPFVDAGLLHFHAARPTAFGFEMHLLRLIREVERFAPDFVVIDPISVFRGDTFEIRSMLVRINDYLKSKQITCLFTMLLSSSTLDGIDMSSLMDTWILLANIDVGSEYNRGLRIRKSRGMHGSKQIREFVIESAGLRVLDTYHGADGLLTGSERETHTTQDHARAEHDQAVRVRQQRHMELKRAILEQQITMMRFAQEDEELKLLAPGFEEPDSRAWLERAGA